MKNLRLFLLLALGCVFLAGTASAKLVKHAKADDADSDEDAVISEPGLVDLPTAGVLDYYGLQNKTRFFSSGSLLDEVYFGVLPRLNLGATATMEEFLGTSSGTRLVRPTIQAKYRFYDGAAYMPALAVGYDGQGYYYDHQDDKFLEKERGLYLVGSHDIFDKSFQIHPGVNISDFYSNCIYGSLGLSFTVEDSFDLMAEWDNIQRFDQSRVNAGVRFHVSPFFKIDAALRDIGKNSSFSDGSPQKTERIVQLLYSTNF